MLSIKNKRYATKCNFFKKIIKGLKNMLKA